ncbi:hypothetical protein Vi05172_g11717 [Venturia inaequalis]|nr:hypothetical protein Vi05172_g11717 [Venturia inaequalis]
MMAFPKDARSETIITFRESVNSSNSTSVVLLTEQNPTGKKAPWKAPAKPRNVTVIRLPEMRSGPMFDAGRRLTGVCNWLIPWILHPHTKERGNGGRSGIPSLAMSPMLVSGSQRQPKGCVNVPREVDGGGQRGAKGTFSVNGGG